MELIWSTPDPLEKFCWSLPKTLECVDNCHLLFLYKLKLCIKIWFCFFELCWMYLKSDFDSLLTTQFMPWRLILHENMDLQAYLLSNVCCFLLWCALNLERRDFLSINLVIPRILLLNIHMALIWDQMSFKTIRISIQLC